MDAITMIKERRSVRKYKDEKVDRETMREIVDIARWAPSWVNYQIARYTLVDDEEIIKEIAEQYSEIIVLEEHQKSCGIGSAIIEGKSGTYDKEYITSKGNSWEVFDAGIACQTFCLAAHAKGVGTCIMGVIDDKSIAKIVNLPEDETVAALIVYGYEDGEHAAPNKRKDVDEIMRFVDR